MTAVGSATSTPSVPTVTKPAGAMDQNDFLRLMTTQLTTQDPFAPVDNTQMVAQMAQFSQVAGISEMNASLKALVEGMNSGRLTDAASWIGRKVLVEADIASPAADGSYGGELALADGAEAVTIDYIDANGVTVRSEQFGKQNIGTLAFAWDGRNEAGETVATGPLKLVARATVNGEVVTPPMATWATVAGIQSPGSGGATRLLTPLGSLSPEEALRLA
jgi:flagellar basal-body rod modification protein FlgD